MVRETVKEGPRIHIVNIIKWALLLLPFYKPDSIAILQIPTIEVIYAATEAVVTVWVICKIIKENPTYLLDKYVVCIIGVAATILLSTLINDQSIRNWLGRWAPRVAVVLLAMHAMKRSPVEFIYGSALLVSTLCIANLCTVIIFPEGLYQTASTFVGDNFFLGHRNGTAVYLYQMLASSLIIENVKSKKFTIGPLTITLYLVALLQTLLAFCATTLLSLIIMALIALVIKAKKARKILSPLSALILSAIGNVSVVLVRVHEVFAPLIEVVLRRDITLSNRTIIWDKAINMLSGTNAVLGKGVDGHRQIIIGETVISSAHNDLLNITLQGGLVSLVLYCGSFYYVAQRITKTCCVSMRLCVTVVMIPLGILSIAYPIASVPVFLMLSIFYFLSSDTVNQKEE